MLMVLLATLTAVATADEAACRRFVVSADVRDPDQRLTYLECMLSFSSTLGLDEPCLGALSSLVSRPVSSTAVLISEKIRDSREELATNLGEVLKSVDVIVVTELPDDIKIQDIPNVRCKKLVDNSPMDWEQLRRMPVMARGSFRQAYKLKAAWMLMEHFEHLRGESYSYAVRLRTDWHPTISIADLLQYSHIVPGTIYQRSDVFAYGRRYDMQRWVLYSFRLMDNNLSNALVEGVKHYRPLNWSLVALSEVGCGPFSWLIFPREVVGDILQLGPYWPAEYPTLALDIVRFHESRLLQFDVGLMEKPLQSIASYREVPAVSVKCCTVDDFEIELALLHNLYDQGLVCHAPRIPAEQWRSYKPYMVPSY
ncbi:unnamed protein product [Symbiodinium sp. CCMP2592]|nr:unnamed protein product [Symbiodinium sp. CCMP2592]